MFSAVVLAVSAALIFGCAGQPATSTEPAISATQSAAPNTDDPAAASPGIRVEGAVENPQTLTLDRLQQFERQTQQVTFDSSTGTQNHHFDGALLFDILNAAVPTPDPTVKNGLLRLAIVVTASDGHSATFAWGEIAPEFGGQQILLAYNQDGKPLPRPRTTAPEDHKGGRYVSNIVAIRVVDPAR
ncbi:molybdopterin-dependent oxidoreductase [Nocardia rhamnosiphila]|uniref:molybdopterin-dependent oxidoreductase n=1 Tax=Nocardia rhamnosiphila TaxID=426716 RepID=UPI0006898DB6|nr:molybdopterin-dependent oxidoreductase [Nocardia rhamnosiphila]